jgi:hypothetical protein
MRPGVLVHDGHSGPAEPQLRPMRSQASRPAAAFGPTNGSGPDHLDAFLDVTADDRIYELFHLVPYRGVSR